MKIRKLFFPLTLSALAGCAAMAPIQPAAPAAPEQPSARHAAPFPASVALLPLENQSLDLRAPEIIRDLLDTYLSANAFPLTDVKEADEQLRGLGISEGGQLSAVTPQKLAAALGADALLYGEVAAFNNANIGVYAGRTVKVRLWLVDGRTGEKLWETEKSKANSQLGLSKAAAKKVLASGYAEKAGENLADNPLYPEAQDVARLLVKALSKARRDW